jgi:hypothetical protein
MGEFPPFALIVDDGELEPCCEVLSHLQLDWMRASTSAPASSLLWPTDLLVSTLQSVARLCGPEANRHGAAWLCVIDTPARPDALEKLRGAGVHFVVRRGPDGDLDRELLRQLFLQMAYSGADRRGSLRMLCSHEVRYVAGKHRGQAQLLDLSASACRILSPYWSPRGSDMQIFLPVELDPQAPTAYPARVLRSAPATSLHGRYMHYLVLEFVLTRELDAKLRYVMSAQQRAPALAALARPHKREFVLKEGDRRDAVRHDPSSMPAISYFHAEAPTLARAHDISVHGLRIEPTRDFQVGQSISLSLYRGIEESPLVLEAQVRRDDGERGLWLAFQQLDPKDVSELGRLLAELPSVESIATSLSPGSSPVIMATIRDPDARADASDSDPAPNPESLAG